MSELNLIESILKILKENKQTESYFETNVKWLEEINEYRTKNYIRVGLIGVTSSGKSTLLNALLGEDLLPSAVRPSSGILITCAKFKNKIATVYFEEGNPKLLKGSVKEKIAKYGDEKLNPGNKKGVNYIDIKTPDFMFDPNIQIVDSPGLDAEGLEYHEQLAMETLLPSVDLCIYVVTMKANSDESTFRAVKTIQRHKKHLIMVQNMLDSVEPKKKKNGVIEKSREQVATEIKKRLERVIAQVGQELKNKTDVVQLSAKQALNGRLNGDSNLVNKSGIFTLVQVVNQKLSELELQIRQQRVEQVKRHLRDLINVETARLKDLEQRTTECTKISIQLETYKQDVAKVKNIATETKEKINKRLKSLVKDCNTSLNDIKRLNEYELTKAEMISDTLKKSISDVEKFLLDSIRSLDSDIDKLIQALNLNLKNFNNDLLPNKIISVNRFSISKKIIQKTTRVKKEGFFATVGRWFGELFNQDWGWETKIENSTVIDKNAVENKFKAEFSEITKQITYFVEGWERRLTLYQDKLDEELRRRDNEIKQKDDLFIEKEIIEKVIYKLNLIIDSKLEEEPHKDEQRHKVEKNTAIHSPEKAKVKIEISRSMFDIFQLSNTFLSMHFRKIWYHCQNLTLNGAKASNTLIWGWDQHFLESFLRRFLNIDLSHKERSSLEQKGFVILEKSEDKILVVKEGNLSDTTLNKIQKFLKNYLNAYLLVNTIQQGAAIKEIRKSKFFLISQNAQLKVNWVAQSVREFIVGRNLDEGLQSLFNIREAFSTGSTNVVLLNDENPLYSMLLLELQHYTSLTLADEHNLLKEFKEKFPYLIRLNESTEIVQLIKAYREGKKYA